VVLGLTRQRADSHGQRASQVQAGSASFLTEAVIAEFAVA
jgi:hypothetical protein